MNLKKILILLLSMFICLSLFTVNATATPIQGEIGFVGLFSATGGTGLADATGLEFSGFLIVADATKDFIPALGNNVAFTDFDFKPFPFTSPVVPLWDIAGPSSYSFDLENITYVGQSETEIILRGTGTLHATGFEDTVGLWNFTGNSFGTVFTFSSGSTPVPDANIMLLLGPALLSLGVFGRKFNKN